MHHLSKPCRNELFSSEETSFGNLTRHNIITWLDQPGGLEHILGRQLVKPSTSLKPGSAPVKCTCAYFTFSSSALEDLKSPATSYLRSRFVSTDEIFTAFIWQ
jgi:hypothetical protein